MCYPTAWIIQLGRKHTNATVCLELTHNKKSCNIRDSACYQIIVTSHLNSSPWRIWLESRDLFFDMRYTVSEHDTEETCFEPYDCGYYEEFSQHVKWGCWVFWNNCLWQVYAVVRMRPRGVVEAETDKKHGDAGELQVGEGNWLVRKRNERRQFKPDPSQTVDWGHSNPHFFFSFNVQFRGIYSVESRQKVEYCSR